MSRALGAHAQQDSCFFLNIVGYLNSYFHNMCLDVYSVGPMHAWILGVHAHRLFISLTAPRSLSTNYLPFSSCKPGMHSQSYRFHTVVAFDRCEPRVYKLKVAKLEP